MKDLLNTLILAVAILLALVIYCYMTRYQIVGAGAGQNVYGGYQVDRITGETWWLGHKTKVKQQEKE
jgi:hypothetical protein